MISSRFASIVALLLGLALVPTVIHSYMPPPTWTDRLATGIPAVLAGESGASTNRRAGWGESRFDTGDWIERRYPGSPQVTLFAGRSLDLKRLYHHPELAIAYGRSYDRATIVRLPQRPDVPVHVLRGTDTNAKGIALYALVYDGRYIESPVAFQIRTSIELLFQRRKPMTLVFVEQQLPSADAPVESSRAAKLLFAALEAVGAE